MGRKLTEQEIEKGLKAYRGAVADAVSDRLGRGGHD